MKYASMYERLVANSEKPDDQNENGCWVWTGKTDGKLYPTINKRVNGKHVTVRAHREMAEQFEGRPLHPDDETIEHLCFTPLCINPDHHITLTRAENTSAMRRRNARS